MPLRPGYMANTAQRAVVTILTVSSQGRYVEGVLRDGGKIQVGINEASASLRWPKTGELWLVTRQGVHWQLTSRVRTESDSVNAAEGELRLDSDFITDAGGKRVIAVADGEEGEVLRYVNGEWVPSAGAMGDKTYVHTQGDSQDTWVVTHNLGKYPSVTVVDSAGTQVFGEVHFDTLDQVTISFFSPFSGKAYCN